MTDPAVVLSAEMAADPEIKAWQCSCPARSASECVCGLGVSLSLRPLSNQEGCQSAGSAVPQWDEFTRRMGVFAAAYCKDKPSFEMLRAMFWVMGAEHNFARPPRSVPKGEG